MPSERVQRRIDKLLDQAEEFADEQDWVKVRDTALSVLAVSSGDEDAKSFLAMAKPHLSELPDVEDPAEELSDAAVTKTQDTPSTFADGRYTVSRLLGEGGKKLVYLAHDSVLDRDVAFGLIKTDGLDDVGRERVLREAQAMGRMGTHPCIMPIYEFGEENGSPYMVQPPMGGGDVEELIEDIDGPLPLEQAIQIATQTAEGLVFAHSKGIIHRDLKPGNVWLDDDGNAKIGDFGLAVATDRSRLTVEKLMVGTVNYMPPEQATGGEFTPRADLYSLGAMLYEMSTGRVPFMGDDDIAVISQHVNTPAVAPSWHNPSIPKTLDSLIIRLMSKNPDERPQSAREVLTALGAVDLSAVEESESDKQTSLDSMAGGVFVGRQREMDNLKSIFEEVLSGKGRMVTLVGEPGIGKTRTASELATYAGMRGAKVLWGRCYESGGAPPYWPWVQAIRSHVAKTEPDELRNQMGSAASVIAEVVSDVREKLTDLPEPTEIGEPESERFRLFDSIATFLKQASSGAPIVLMLEDLHWSDKPSLMLLEFVARELANSKIMVVGNYRDMELNRRHPLSVTLGDLSRERLFERVVLRGLQKHDVHRFIEIAAGISPPPALVEAVFSQTEGNPLFVTETVRLLIQEGDITAGRSTGGGTTSWEIRIPEGVREVIGRRLDRLSERCNELLTIAAVIGRQFRFDILKMLAEDTTDGQLLDAMDEALSARIIEELEGEVGFYQFTHAQMQETLIQELSHTRAVRMHARIAEALEAHYGDEAPEHAAELAHHFSEAVTVVGDTKMIHYSKLAGEAALDRYAYDEAQVHFERALSAKERDKMDAEQAALLFGLGRAQIALLDFDDALKNFGLAFEYYAAAGEIESALEIAEHRLPSAFALFPGATKIAERALELVPPNSLDAGRILPNYLGLVGMQYGDRQKTLQALDQAIAIADRENDKALEFRLLGTASITVLYHDNYVNQGKEILRLCDRAIALSESIDDLWSDSMVRYVKSIMLSQSGEPDSASEIGRLALQSADQLRDRSQMSRTNFGMSLVPYYQGDWDTARDHTDKGIVYAPDDPRSLFIRSQVEYETGNAVEGDRFLDRSIEIAASTQKAQSFEYSISAAAVAFASLISGDNSRLNSAEENARVVLSTDIATPFVKMFAHMTLATAAIVRGDMTVAATMYEHFLPLRKWHPFVVSGDRLLGMTALAMGDSSRAEGHFQDAISFTEKAGYRPQQGWSLHEYSELLLDRDAPGDREKANKLQDEAIAIATELGMQPLLERVLAQREILKA